MIMHILLPDAGRIEVLGSGAGAGPGQAAGRAGRGPTHAARDRVSYLPEERGLYKKMTVRRLLRYYGQLKGRTIAELDPVINEWMARLGMDGWGDRKIETLSKGMSQKVQFVGAVVNRPELLILDEPFSGLDPVNAESLKDAVLEIRRRGTTVVFSTHDMSTAERMCDRIFMIFRGRKVLDGTLEDIQAQYGFDTVRVRTAAGAAVLAGMPGLESINDYGQLQELRLKGDPQRFLQDLAARTTVYHFEIARPSLHDIFVRIARPAV
jgi:ABC-2 type transport system ATP-binding protein